MIKVIENFVKKAGWVAVKNGKLSLDKSPNWGMYEPKIPEKLKQSMKK